MFSRHWTVLTKHRSPPQGACAQGRPEVGTLTEWPQPSAPLTGLGGFLLIDFGGEGPAGVREAWSAGVELDTATHASHPGWTGWGGPCVTRKGQHCQPSSWACPVATQLPICCSDSDLALASCQGHREALEGEEGPVWVPRAHGVPSP